MDYEYAKYATKKAKELLSIDSPTGFTDRAADWVQNAFTDLGFEARRTVKGGVLVDFGGEKGQDGLILMAHTDTLGDMVAEVKANGRLRIVPLGGLSPQNIETENVRVYTRDGRVIEGTCQLINASTHVNGKFGSEPRSFDTLEIVLDEPVTTAEEARGFGIETGDLVCFEPRTRVTASGYIKSRFLDDKLSVGILLGLGKYLKDTGAKLSRPVYAHITVYEEVGHGASASIP